MPRKKAQPTLQPGDVERKPGFYWLDMGQGKWEPAEWTGTNWFLIGGLRPFHTDEFDQIGDRIERNP